MKKIISGFVLLLILALVASWGITIGIYYLITLCFNIGFSWKIGTGIWMIMYLIGVACKS
jgi:hypothetical protein